MSVAPLAMPFPQDGNTYLPFVELMKLEKIDEDTFRSIAQPFSPGGNHPRAHGVAYGGHVYAQAAWAAAQTMSDGFVLHVCMHSLCATKVPSSVPGLLDVCVLPPVAP